MSQSTSPVCIVTGVGAGTGAAVCRRFAREGYRVAMLARSEESLAEIGAAIPGTVAFPTDVTDEPALRATLQRVRNELGPARVRGFKIARCLLQFARLLFELAAVFEHLRGLVENLHDLFETNALALDG